MAENIIDIAIIGAGPAGLSAAVNAKIRNKSIIIFGGEAERLKKSPRVDNYLGFIEIKGEELVKHYLKHVEHMGIEINDNKVNNVFPMGGTFGISLKNGDLHRAKTVIIATGISNTKYLKGEQELVGKGVSYCATCDGPLYRGKDVALVGYTPEESEAEVNFLAEICNKVYYIPMYKEEGQVKEQIEIINQKPVAINGQERVANLELDGSTVEVEGIFIIRETTPVDQLLPGLEIAENAIKVNRDLATNIPGAFAAGDCTGKPWQIAKAVGEGQVAALSAVKYLDELK
jgi:thioredoxin reductase (NADPH)